MYLPYLNLLSNDPTLDKKKRRRLVCDVISFFVVVSVVSSVVDRRVRPSTRHEILQFYLLTAIAEPISASSHNNINLFTYRCD